MVCKAHLVRKRELGEISISESVAVKILKGDITFKKATYTYLYCILHG